MPGGTDHQAAHGGDSLTTDTPFCDHRRRDLQVPARCPTGPFPDSPFAGPRDTPARPLGEGAPPPRELAFGGAPGLTDDQRCLARLVAAGAAPVEIAARLDRSPRRVARDLQALPVALGLASLEEVAVAWWGTRAGARTDLVAAAARLGVAA